MTDKLQIGRCGEDAALRFLKQKGYEILEKNFRTKLGEIDVIAKDGNTVCFIEVKTRTTPRFGSPLEAVSKMKQHKISRIALLYLTKKKWMDKQARFDVVAVYDLTQGGKQVELVKNAFELA